MQILRLPNKWIYSQRFKLGDLIRINTHYMNGLGEINFYSKQSCSWKDIPPGTVCLIVEITETEIFFLHEGAVFGENIVINNHGNLVWADPL